jgi:hypothetical protein
MPRQSLKHEPSEVSPLMLVPQYIIVALMILIGLFPGYVVNVAGTIMGRHSFPDFSFDPSGLSVYFSVLKSISFSSLLFLAIIGLMFAAKWFISKGNEKKYAATWGCAYSASDSRMQYTGKSFSKSFGKLLSFVMIEKKGYTEIKRKELFPESRKYHSFYLDLFESKIINPVIQFITRFFNLFLFIQNGKVQAYIIYGIVFIMVIFIGTILNIWH